MIGDNDDFAISVPIMSTSSSVQNSVSPAQVQTAKFEIDAKSTNLESDSSSSSSSSDSTSSDSETETPAQAANGKLNIYCIYCHKFFCTIFYMFAYMF